MLSAILLDDTLWERAPEPRRQEWRLAIRELIESHVFATERSPLVLRIAVESDAVQLKWEVPGSDDLGTSVFPRAELETHLAGYAAICREMGALADAKGDAARLLHLDKAKKSAHDDGARMILLRCDVVGPTHDTARRIFTLLVTLLLDTTTLHVLKRPHEGA